MLIYLMTEIIPDKVNEASNVRQDKTSTKALRCCRIQMQTQRVFCLKRDVWKPLLTTRIPNLVASLSLRLVTSLFMFYGFLNLPVLPLTSFITDKTVSTTILCRRNWFKWTLPSIHHDDDEQPSFQSRVVMGQINSTDPIQRVHV